MGIKYLESLPLHPSQFILPKNENGQYVVTYLLIPNYEFKTLLLELADSIWLSVKIVESTEAFILDEAPAAIIIIEFVIIILIFKS